MGHYSKPSKRVWISLFLWTSFIIATLTTANVIYVSSLMGLWSETKIDREVASNDLKEKTNHPVPDQPLEINCHQNKARPKMKTVYGQTRLIFKNCEPTTKVVNLSNQIEADLFLISKDNYTTDMIILKQGLNRIEARWKNKKQIIEITRELPSSQVVAKDL